MSGDHNEYQKTKSYLDDFECPRCGHCCQALETEREWVGLTDQEINSVCYKRDWTAPWTNTTFARAIEAKLREKNKW